MKLSIIICTHNPRPHYLARVLEALRAQSLPLADWELLLIDNASRTELKSFVDLTWHPHGRVIREETLGLTAARLRGIREGLAELLVFVDDDNVLNPDYLAQAVRISHEFPFLGVWGGQVLPEYEVPPPGWAEPLLASLALFSCPRDVWSNVGESLSRPCGAGMCVRAAVAQRYLEEVTRTGGWRANLDRRGTDLSSCGDVDLALTALDLNLGTGRFVALGMKHLIPAERLGEDYLLRLAQGNAYSGAILATMRKPVVNQIGKGRRENAAVDHLLHLLKRLPLPNRARRFHLAARHGAAQARRELAHSAVPDPQSNPSSQRQSDPLRVLYLPRMADFNPYGKQLPAALERLGVQFMPFRWGPRLPHFDSIVRNRTLPDLVHQQWIHVYTIKTTFVKSLAATALFLFQMLVLRFLGVPVVWTLHNKANHAGRFLGLDRFGRRTMCRLASAVIVHSEGAKSEVITHLNLSTQVRKKLHVVPHASYVNSYPNHRTRTEARAVLGFSSEEFCFGFVGGMQPYKGAEDLVNAFRQLEGERFRLVLAGQPVSIEQRRWFEEQSAADPRIIVALGHIPDEELQTYFMGSDAIVYPFHRQLTSGSLLLAASFGRALVVPAIDSLLEGLPAAGRLRFNQGEVQALGAAMREVATRDTAAMGVANRQQMESAEMSWQTMARRTLAVYESVLKPDRAAQRTPVNLTIPAGGQCPPLWNERKSAAPTLSWPMNEHLEQRMRENTGRYYRDILGLPDWATRIEGRVERKYEAYMFQRLVHFAGSLEGKRVLDLGCGWGGVVCHAARVAQEAIGIEPDEERLTIAQELLQPLSNARAFKGVGEQLPFADSSLDLIASYQVLEHVQDPAKVIAEVARVLKPGGIFHFSTPNYMAFWEPHYKVGWFPLLPKPLGRLYLKLRGRDPAFLGHIQYVNPINVRRLLRLNGLHFVDLRHQSATAKLRTLLDRCVAWLPCGRFVSRFVHPVASKLLFLMHTCFLNTDQEYLATKPKDAPTRTGLRLVHPATAARVENFTMPAAPAA